MITKLEGRFQTWKSEYCIDEISLGFYRILFCVWLVLFYPPSYAWLGDVPKAFYDPPILSLASLLDSFPDRSFFLFLDILIAVSLLMVAVGFLTRSATAALLIAQLVGNSFQYSFGKIDHSIFVQCVLLVMLIVNWGRALSIDQILSRRDAKVAPTIWLLAVFLAFGFFSAGFGKAVHWIDWDFEKNGFLNWLYSGYYTLNRQELLAPLAMKVRPLWIWEAADFTAVLFELGFVVAIFRRRWFMIWLLVACLFHLTNCLVLNISFAPYSMCYLAFVPWSQLIPRLSRMQSIPLKLVMAVCVVMILSGPPLSLFRSVLASPVWKLERGVLMWASCGLILAFTLKYFWTEQANRPAKEKVSAETF